VEPYDTDSLKANPCVVCDVPSLYKAAKLDDSRVDTGFACAAVLYKLGLKRIEEFHC
jgi:hypothetical protein